MKYIFFFFLVSTAAIVMPNMLGKTKQSPAETAIEIAKLSPDSISWFEANLDIYIPKEYMFFSPTEYKQALTKGIRDTLGFEYWLGTFTIVDMVSENGYIMINLSKEDHRKLMFITPTYFVITSYMNAEKETGITHGSSLIYFPKKNVVQELETFIVFEVEGDKLDGALEHYELGEKNYIEYGQYDVHKKTFTLAE